MTPRSLLFVPGDSERKQARALQTAADALILDLEDSVAPNRRAVARSLVRTLLDSCSNRVAQQMWVRVNALASGELLTDLTTIVGGAPDGIVLPKVSSPEELLEVHHYLLALEQRENLPASSIKLIVIATETPRALLTLAGYPAVPQRLAGLTWGTEDLSAALGVGSKLDEGGALTFTFQLARSLCLVTAAAAGVPAIDGIHADFRDRAGLEREAARARRDGFGAKLAIHPDQIDAINAVFSPTEQEVEYARKVVAAFTASPDCGVTSLDGKMLDRPHLLQAQRVLGAAARAEGKP